MNSKIYCLQEVLFRLLNILQHQQLLVYLQCYKAEDFIYFNAGLLRDQTTTIQHQFSNIQFFPNLDVSQLRIEEVFSSLAKRLRLVKDKSNLHLQDQQGLSSESTNSTAIKFLKKLHQMDYSLLHTWAIHQLTQETLSATQRKLISQLLTTCFHEQDCSKKATRERVQQQLREQKQSISL